jgi:hypothetical protein
MKGVDTLLLKKCSEFWAGSGKTERDIRIWSTEQGRLHQAGDHISLTIDDNLYSVVDIGTKTWDTREMLLISRRERLF